MNQLTWVNNDPAGVTKVNATRMNLVEDRLAFTPRAYSAVGDGVADDTVPIRNMLAAHAREADAGLEAFTVDLGPYTYRLTDTVEIAYRDVVWLGRGIGNPRNYGPGAPSSGSTFRWDGAAGIPMFRIVDSLHVQWRNILFQGNVDPLKRPSEFVYCVGGGTIGTNMHILYTGCRFGSFPWTTPLTANLAKTADNGIRYGGANANNDRMFIENCQFEDITTGLNLPNTQSVWGSVKDTDFTQCTTGIDTNCDLTLVNANFQGCGTDLKMRSTARVRALSWGSENSGQIASIVDPGGSLTVVGGRWLVLASMTNNRAVDYTNLGDATALALVGIHLDHQGGTKPKIYGRRNSAGGPGHLYVRACPGITAASDFDVIGASGGIDVDVRSHGFASAVVLGAGQALGATDRVATDYILTTGEDTGNRASLGNSNSAPASQTLSLTYFTAQKTETIVSIETRTATTAAAATPTRCQVGIYSEAANGDLTLVTSTANDTALWAAAFTAYTRALSAAWSKVGGQRYAIGTLVVNAGATPNFIGPNTSTAGIAGEVLAKPPRLSGSVTAQATLPSSVLNGNIGQSTTPTYAAMIP